MPFFGRDPLSTGLLLYLTASLIYLTHDLTFVIFLAAIVITSFFLLLQDRRWWALIVSRPNIYGLLLLGATVATYTVATALAGIQHPGYLYSNPAAYQLDNLGELFHILGYAPLWFPIGPPVALDPSLALAILIGTSLAIVVLAKLVRHLRPSWVPPRLSIALAVLVAVLVTPAGGYLVHIDTDYPRFAFFFAVPMALVVSILAERVGLGWIASHLGGTPAPATEETEPSTPEMRIWYLSPRERQWTLHAGILVALSLVFIAVSLPTVALSENTYATPTHDATFVSAANWLKSNDTPGAVLADTSDSQRWVEALSGRNSVSAGPTWLHFYSSEVLMDEESFWAENSHYVISNNQAALSLSGFSSSSLNQSPMYSVFVQGVILPVLRIPPPSFIVNVVNLSDNDTTLVGYNSNWTITGPFLTDNAGLALSVTFSDPPYFSINDTATLGAGGAATIGLMETPGEGYAVNSIGFNISQPQPTALGHWYPISELGPSVATRMNWTLASHLGPLPGVYPLTTSLTLQPAPTVNPGPKHGSYIVTSAGTPVESVLLFKPNPIATGQPFLITINLSTPGTGNPATTYPSYFDTDNFLSSNDIRFFVAQNINFDSDTILYMESEFGFRQVYENSGWVVLFR